MWQPQSIYNEYLLRTPVLLVGNEAVNGLYNYPATRIAVIHGKSFNEQELIKKIFKKKEVAFFNRSWKGEPDLEGLNGTLHELESFSPDTIIAVGGGSVIDGSKLCRLFYEIPYFQPKVTKLDGSLLTTSFIVIPTTIGTGAEVSSAAVYVDDDHKEMVVLHELQPDVIVYDKRYAERMPLKQLFASVIDAVSHIVEGYVSKIHNVMLDIRAEEALRLIRTELHNYLNERSLEYSRLQYAGYLGGVVQNHCIVGACHAVAHQLTQYCFSHGEAVALLLPAVVKMNSKDPDINEKYQKLCNNSGFTDVEELLTLVENVCEKAEILCRKNELRDILKSNENNDGFLNNIKNDRGGKGNPIEITDDYIRELIRSV